MFINILSWVFLGVFAGILVQFIFPMNKKYLSGLISAGIVGAFVGGIIYSAFQIGSVAVSLDPFASFMALVGSLLLIYFIRILVSNETEVQKKA